MCGCCLWSSCWTALISLSQSQLFDFKLYLSPNVSFTLPTQVQVSGSTWLVGISGSLVMSISQDLSALLSANWVVLIHARPGWQYSLHARCSLLQGHFLVAQRVLQLHVTDGRVSLVSVLLTGGTVVKAPVLMGGSVI